MIDFYFRRNSARMLAKRVVNLNSRCGFGGWMLADHHNSPSCRGRKRLLEFAPFKQFHSQS